MSPQPSASPSLSVRGGPRDGETVALEAEGTEKMLGSAAGADLCVGGSAVEAVHARVAWEERGLVLYDETTSTGTFVNGARVREEHVLQDGDRISLGPPGTPESAALEARVPPGVGGGAEAFALTHEEDAPVFDTSRSADPDPLVLDHAPDAGGPPPGRPAVAPPPSTPAVIDDTASAAGPAPPAGPGPRKAAPDYQTAVSIGGDRIRAPLEVPAAPDARRAGARPAGRPRRGVPRAALLGLAAALVGTAGFLAYGRLHRAPPVLASVSPSKAEPGGTVTITGAGFDPRAAGQVVRFGHDQGTVESATETQIAVVVPPDLAASGPADVQVVVDRGGARSNALFLRVARLPRITRLEPDVALPGAEVVVVGQNLGGASAVVKIGGQRAAIETAGRRGADALAVVVPDMPFTEGQGVPLTVEAAGETARPATLYLGRLPLVAELSPASGPPGQRLAIKGRGFEPNTAANLVTLGGEPALVLSASPAELQVAVPAVEGGAAGARPVVVKAGAGTSVPVPFTVVSTGTRVYRPRFFPAPAPGAGPDRHVLVSTELGPVLLLSGRADAPSAAERGWRVSAALNAAMEQASDRAVAVEVREGPAPAVALAGGAVIVTATAEDSDGYAQAWEGAGRASARVPPRQVAAYWAALVEDYLALFGRGQRPTRTVELSTRGKVLLELFGEAQRHGMTEGVPIGVRTGLTPAQHRGLRELALTMPAAGSATPGAAVTGRWDGEMEDGGNTRSLSFQFRVEGGRLAGVLTTRMGGLSIGIPLDEVAYEKGTLSFLATVGGGTRQFRGTIEGSRLSGRMVDRTGRQELGAFSARFVE